MSETLLQLSIKSLQLSDDDPYAGKQTSKGARGVVFGRIKFNLASGLLSLGARFLKLFDCCIAQLAGLGLGIIGNRPSSVEVFTGTEATCRSGRRWCFWSSVRQDG